MNIAYLLAVALFAISLDHYNKAKSTAGCRPDVGVFPILFDIFGMLSTLGFLVLFIVGFFIENWWTPLVSLMISWLLVAIFRSVSPVYSWFIVILFGLAGCVSATLVFFPLTSNSPNF